MKFKRTRFTIAAALVAASLAACGSSGDEQPDAVRTYEPTGSVLNIVAGSEQELVFSRIVAPWCETQDVDCKFTKLGSVDQARLLQTGEAPYDAFWFASDLSAQLGNQDNVLQHVEYMFTSPIVFAGWQSEMENLGFVGRPEDNPVKIEEVLDAVESGRTDVWVTNPTQSNSGASILFAMLNYFAGNGTGVPLSAEQLSLPAVQDGISRFVRAFDQTPSSTGTLMTDCLARQDECRSMFTYEALVIEKNQELLEQDPNSETLYAVYPEGSLAIADSPLGFYPHAGPENTEKEQHFLDLQEYLLSDEAQQQLLEIGRRPISNFGLSLTNAPQDIFSPDWGIQAQISQQPISFPSVTVIQTALANYQTSYRTPVDAVYCLDGSGSMDDVEEGGNGGWVQVEESAELLFNPAKAEQYLLQVNPDDRTTVIIFDGDIKAGPWTVDGDQSSQLLDLHDKIVAQEAGGDTGIFRCLGHAADFFRENPSGSRKQIVVLMSDGQDSFGDPAGLDAIKALDVPVIAIGFSQSADARTLGFIATETGGAYLYGDDLTTTLREATGYK